MDWYQWFYPTDDIVLGAIAQVNTIPRKIDNLQSSDDVVVGADAQASG
jgi:hypothetical protein